MWCALTTWLDTEARKYRASMVAWLNETWDWPSSPSSISDGTTGLERTLSVSRDSRAERKPSTSRRYSSVSWSRSRCFILK